MPRLPRWLRLAGYIAAFLLLVAALIVFVPPYRGLPKTGGKEIVGVLDDVVAVQRDALGVVTISATNRRDAARATGFVHAQERFFQMDLMRRLAAGELAELFGPVALPADRKNRVHRLRAVAQAARDQLASQHRELVEDYTHGVNAGLAALDEIPFEYLLLRTKPAPWRAEDTMLVFAAMALGLQETDGQPDRARGTIRDTFSPEVAAFFLSGADAFEAPLDGSTIPLPPLPAAPALRANAPAAAAAPTPAPTAETVSARAADDLAARMFAAYLPPRDPDAATGSNAFAIAGNHTAGLSAILANDVHLGLSVPNTWFRLQLKWTGADTRIRIVNGASLPGTPAIVLGTNGAVAWGVTNAYLDTSDVVIVEVDPANPSRYLTPEGPKEFLVDPEKLKVRGGEDTTISVSRTIWGPVIGRDAANRVLVLHWAMHRPDAYNFEFLGLEEVASVRAALAFAKISGMPQQNFVCADRHGDIGWTIAGRIPRRVGTDGLAPESWADGRARWDGWLPATEYPQVVNPPEGRIWSANARMVGGAALAALGDGEYRLASRAAQIRDRLMEKDQFTPADALAVQLDDRGRHLERWQQLLVATLSPEALTGAAARAELKQLAERWGGRAVPDSAGYRLVREFRRHALARIQAVVFAPCVARDPAFKPEALLREEPLYTLAARQPEGWIAGGRAGWTKLLLDAADETIAEAGGAGKLATYTWGKFNRLDMRHPLSRGVPVIGSWLDMGRPELSGDADVVRAQLPDHGPSVRLVFLPGRENESLFQMPGGQSGNPLSSHYRDSLKSWVKGEPMPLLPHRVEDHLTLHPVSRN